MNPGNPIRENKTAEAKAGILSKEVWVVISIIIDSSLVVLASFLVITKASWLWFAILVLLIISLMISIGTLLGLRDERSGEITADK